MVSEAMVGTTIEIVTGIVVVTTGIVTEAGIMDVAIAYLIKFSTTIMAKVRFLVFLTRATN